MAIVASRPVADVDGEKLCENVRPGVGEQADFTTKTFLLKNVTGTAPVFLGPQGTTVANGFQWDPADGPLELELEPGESMYGIVAATPQTIHVAGQGR